MYKVCVCGDSICVQNDTVVMHSIYDNVTATGTPGPTAVIIAPQVKLSPIYNYSESAAIFRTTNISATSALLPSLSLPNQTVWPATGWEITASSERNIENGTINYQSAYILWAARRAIEYYNGTGFCWLAKTASNTSGYTNQWWQMKFPEKVALIDFSFTYTDSSPSEWKLQFSDTGQSFTDLEQYVVSGLQRGVRQTFQVTNEHSPAFIWRLAITRIAIGTNYAGLLNIRFNIKI